MNTKIITKTMHENLNRFIQHTNSNIETSDILNANVEEKTVTLKKTDGLFEKKAVIEKMGKKIISEDNRQFLRD